MDQVQQPVKSTVRGVEPISGGVKALLVIISILFCPVGSLIAWVYGARNADRPGAGLVRITGMIFTVLSVMIGLVFGAAVMMIPGLITKGQDGFLTQPPAAPPAAAVNMQAGQPQGIEETPPEIAAKIREIRETVSLAVQAYFEEHGVYPTLEELNATGLLDERFAEDPAQPEEFYLVQVVPWTDGGKPGCNVNVKYTGPESKTMGAGQVVTGGIPESAFAEQSAAEAAAGQVAGETQQAGEAAPHHRGSGKRGAARWLHYL